MHTQVGRSARLIPLGRHEPFLSLSRPERPAAHPTVRQSRGSVRRRECYSRLRVSSACRGSVRRVRLDDDASAIVGLFPLGTNAEEEEGRSGGRAVEKRDIYII